MSNTSLAQRMADKVALVTGAASGIGAAVAKRLAAESAKVALADIDERGIRQVAEAIESGGGQVLPVRLDVTSEAEWQTTIAAVVSKAAIRYFSQVAALEGAPHKIRVNSISPGAVATSMWRGAAMWPAQTEAQKGRSLLWTCW